MAAKKKKPRTRVNASRAVQSAATHKHNASRGDGKAQFEFTVFNKSGGPLTKRISRKKDGTVFSDGSACKMWKGAARRVAVSGVEEFAEIIGGLRSSQGIALGTMRKDLADEVKVVTVAKLNGATNVIARTRENFVFRKGKPALAPIDFDRNGMPDAVQKRVGDDFWSALTTALPELADVARVMRRSTSSGLYNGDVALPASGGWHGFVLVADGDDIERFIKTLHERCWLHGLGWFLITKDAKLDERSLIDCSVATPEHLIFEGPPIVVPPLRQDAENRRPIAYAGAILDTHAACPELTAAEQKTVEALKEKMRAKMRPEADRVRAAYIKETLKELVKRTGMSKAEALKAAESQCAGVLPEHFVLEFRDNKFNGCTVGDVLSDPERFERASLADPIEGPGYKSGRTTATIMLRRDNGYPWIKSYAHGGDRSFTLVRKPGDELKLGFPGRIPDYAQKKPATASPTATKETTQTSDERRFKQITLNIEIGDDIKEEFIFPTVMTLEEMHERLVYIGSSGVIVDRVTGRIRKKEVAKSEYAASRTCIDEKKGTMVPTVKLWMSSRERKQVDVLGWVPGAPQICRPSEAIDGAKTAFNSWSGLPPPPNIPKNWKKQAKPFIDHIAFLVPVKAERERFLQWFAHIIQCPEVLPHTAYLMTTRKTGIGRNLLASIITRVLRGHVAAGVALPELLDGGFTGRLSRKLLAIVDEAREGSGDKRFQRAERLKSLVTEEHRHINIKYGTQSIEKNCCRWLMFSNHADAIPFDNTDRRVIVIENPTERKPTEYYKRLFALLDDKQFIASVWKLLATLDISDFSPGEHAPMNVAKTKALEFMMTDVECVVHDFKEDCKTQLTSREAIRSFVDIQINKTINENHLTHAIAACEMVNTGRRIRDAQGKKQSVVIVREGDWTREKVQQALSDDLLAAMGQENEIERTVRIFKSKALKNRTLVSRENIRSSVKVEVGREVTEYQLTAAIAASKMLVTPRRVQFKGQRHTVVIVRENDEKWSPEKVVVAATAELLVALGLKNQDK